jgi:serine/threonine protein kinase/tetratricopeptide (TPR) repeat protein
MIETAFAEDKIGKHFIARNIENHKKNLFSVLESNIKTDPQSLNNLAEISRTLSQKCPAEILLPVDSGKTGDGKQFIVSEYEEMPTLKSLIKSKGCLPVEDAAAISFKIACAMNIARTAEICHYDLNPDIILVDGSRESGFRARILRFGFHYLLDFYSPSRKDDPFYGSQEYMSPELCSGKTGDTLSDIYSAGILMYEMISGKPPFVSNNISTTMKRQIYEKPLPLHLIKSAAFHINDFEKIILKMLQKDTKQRYTSFSEVMNAIEQFKNDFIPSLNLESEPSRAVENRFGAVSAVVPPRQITEDLMLKGEQAAERPRETLMFTGLAETLSAMKEEADKKPAIADLNKMVEAEKIKAESAKTPEKEPVKSTRTTGKMPPTSTQKSKKRPKPSEDWFIEDAHKVTEEEKAQAPFEIKKSGSRIMWVVIGAAVVAVIVAAALYFGAGVTVSEKEIPAPVNPFLPVAPKQLKPSIPPVKVEPVQAMAVPDAVQDTAAEKDAVQVSAGDTAKPETAQEQIDRAKAEIEQSMKLLSEARTAYKSGDLEKAKEILEKINSMPLENSEAKSLLAEVNGEIEKKKQDAEKKEKEEKAKEEKKEAEKKIKPKKVAVIVKEKVVKEIKTAEPPPQPKEDTAEQVKKLIQSGKAAEEKGNYKLAVTYYKKALQLAPENKLLQNLINKAEQNVNQ